MPNSENESLTTDIHKECGTSNPKSIVVTVHYLRTLKFLHVRARLYDYVTWGLGTGFSFQLDADAGCWIPSFFFHRIDLLF